MLRVSKLIYDVPYSTSSSLEAEALSKCMGFGLQLYEFTHQDCQYLSGLWI